MVMTREMLTRRHVLLGTAALASAATAREILRKDSTLPSPRVDGGPAVRPESFGAKGDGRSDDAPAFEAALASGAGSLILSRDKTYRLSRAIAVKNRELAVAGNGATIDIQSSRQAFAFTNCALSIKALSFVGADTVHGYHAWVNNLAEKARTTVNAYSFNEGHCVPAIRCEGCSGTIEDVESAGIQSQLLLIKSPRMTITRCRHTGFMPADRSEVPGARVLPAFWIEASDGVEVRDSWAFRSGSRILVRGGSKGVRVYGGGTTFAKDNGDYFSSSFGGLIEGAWHRFNRGFALKMRGGSNTVRSCIVEDALNGIRLTTAGSRNGGDCLVYGNVIRRYEGHGIDLIANQGNLLASARVENNRIIDAVGEAQLAGGSRAFTLNCDRLLLKNNEVNGFRKPGPTGFIGGMRMSPMDRLDIEGLTLVDVSGPVVVQDVTQGLIKAPRAAFRLKNADEVRFFS